MVLTVNQNTVNEIRKSDTRYTIRTSIFFALLRKIQMKSDRKSTKGDLASKHRKDLTAQYTGKRYTK